MNNNHSPAGRDECCWPAPAAADVVGLLFRGTDRLGRIVELRLPGPAEIEIFLSAPLTDLLQGAEMSQEELTGFALTSQTLADIVDVTLNATRHGDGVTLTPYPATGALPTRGLVAAMASGPGDLVDQSVPLIAPAWFLTAPVCDGDDACPCGPTTLTEALEQLPTRLRSAAADAHLRMLVTLADHADAARRLASGLLGPGDGGLAHCLACLVDAGRHAQDVQQEMTSRATELADAVGRHSAQIMFGPADL